MAGLSCSTAGRSPVKRLLFLHGAGGYDEDRPLADALGAALGADVDLPPLPDADMSFEAWAAPVRRSLAAHDAGDLVIAHSFGASILLRVLADGGPLPNRAALLAMPDWGRQGWDVTAYAFDGPEPPVTLSLHHCRDDDVVPFAHLARNAALLPSAQVYPYDVGGHQFDGLAATIAGHA